MCIQIEKHRCVFLENGEQYDHVLCTGPSNTQEDSTHQVSGGADENSSSAVDRSTKPVELGCAAHLSEVVGRKCLYVKVAIVGGAPELGGARCYPAGRHLWRLRSGFGQGGMGWRPARA